MTDREKILEARARDEIVDVFKGRDGGLEVGAGEWIRMLANGQRMASDAFGIEFDALRPGS